MSDDSKTENTSPSTVGAPDVADSTAQATTSTEPKSIDCINETERNGSITGIGVVLGFSLIFTGQLTLASGTWRQFKVLALGISGAGIVFQLLALLAILSLPLISKDIHRRAFIKFIVGVVVMLIGFAAHVFIDVAVDVLKWPVP